MFLKFPILVRYTNGALSALIIPDLHIDIFDKVQRLYATTTHLDSFEVAWRAYASQVLSEYLNDQTVSGKLIKNPLKIKNHIKNFELSTNDHWEKIEAVVQKDNKGLFERFFPFFGKSINFTAAVANMIVQILSIEITAGDKSSGRNYAIPMSFIACCMSIVTYNYSGALETLAIGGRKVDESSIIQSIGRSFPFKQIGVFSNWLSSKFTSLKEYVWPAKSKTTKSTGTKLACVSNSTCRILFKITPALTLSAMQATWTTTASIEAFQIAKTISEKSKEIEPFMTDELAYFLAIVLATTSGISMGTFYVPFVINCINAVWRKIDLCYKNASKAHTSNNDNLGARSSYISVLLDEESDNLEPHQLQYRGLLSNASVRR